MHVFRRRRRIGPGTTLVLALTCALVSGALVVTAPDGAHGVTATVSVRVNPAVSATFSDDGVVIRANTGWRVEAASEDGASPVTVTGGPTSGSFIPLPNGAAVLSVVADS